MTRIAFAWGLCLMVCAPVRGIADDALVAVAANFAVVARELVMAFEANGGHRVELAVGSTGKLYAQITNGAPFDAFLAADQARPRRLEAEGFAVSGSRFTYAIGHLALVSRNPRQSGQDHLEVLRSGDFQTLAIANPELAPYGRAAIEVLESLGIHAATRDRLVLGENVGQAYAMVASGNAEIGLVAWSVVRSRDPNASGIAWEVPAHLHAPIRQDAVLLGRGQDNAAAIAFLDFLAAESALAIIEDSGYSVDRPER